MADRVVTLDTAQRAGVEWAEEVSVDAAVRRLAVAAIRHRDGELHRRVGGDVGEDGVRRTLCRLGRRHQMTLSHAAKADEADE